MLKKCAHYLPRSGGLTVQNLVPRGSFVRKSDSKWVKRWQCTVCSHSFSSATFSACFRQKKRRLNRIIWESYCKSDPQRRIARTLKISRTTVVKKIKFLKTLKERSHQRFLDALREEDNPPQRVYMDEMISFVHTKCRPVKIAMIVTEKRKILGFEVSKTVPNSQRLIEIARKKYGPPVDETNRGLRKLLEKTKSYIHPNAEFITDEHPHYGRWIRSTFPQATHERHKSKRASVAGQEELKTKSYDPLFPINHTFAMTRAHVARLVRSTWCTSKSIEGLVDHLTVYMHYHNTVLV